MEPKGTVTSLERVRVLVSAPNAEAGQSIRSALQSIQVCKVIVAYPSAAVIREVEQTPCDVVLLDSELQDPDPYQLAPMLRSEDFGWEGLPLVLVTPHPPDSPLVALAHEFRLQLANYHDATQLSAALRDALGGVIKPRVLVIEDNQQMADAVQFSLQQRYDIEIASSGESGLDAWRQRRHDLIILDLILPGMRGDEVLRKIRLLDRQQPIIVLTAQVGKECHEEMVRAGASAFLPKPFRLNVLRQTCSWVLRTRHLRETHREAEEAGRQLEDLEDGLAELRDHFNSGLIKRASDCLTEVLGRYKIRGSRLR